MWNVWHYQYIAYSSSTEMVSAHQVVINRSSVCLYKPEWAYVYKPYVWSCGNYYLQNITSWFSTQIVSAHQVVINSYICVYTLCIYLVYICPSLCIYLVYEGYSVCEAKACFSFRDLRSARRVLLLRNEWG